MIAAQYKLSVLQTLHVWHKMSSWMQSIERTLRIVNAVGTYRLDTSIQCSVFLRQRKIGVALNSMLRCAGVLSLYNKHLCCFCFTFFVCRFSVGKDCSIFTCFRCTTFHTFSSSTLPRIVSCLEHAPSLNVYWKMKFYWKCQMWMKTWWIVAVDASRRSGCTSVATKIFVFCSNFNWRPRCSQNRIIFSVHFWMCSLVLALCFNFDERIACI